MDRVPFNIIAYHPRHQLGEELKDKKIKKKYQAKLPLDKNTGK
jgi:hypothetical protein